jgi:stearoyl-CoA desaturase (delta-9 desaturase)
MGSATPLAPLFPTSPRVKAFRATFIGLLHVPPLTLLARGTAVGDAIAFAIFYLVAMFVIGAGLHRYFAHRSFRTSRAFQLVLGVLVASFFGDPIGFAGKHRLHHRHADTERDFHGPRRGLWFSWIGHLLEDGYSKEEVLEAAGDLARFPELVWLHRYGAIVGVVAASAAFYFGGYGVFAAGYCLSWCVVAIHGASAVNTLCHFGRHRRYDTPDRSGNSPILGLLLLGEGWHNNHHRYPAAARAGFFWYEPDPLYWALRVLALFGVVWDLREPPDHVRLPDLLPTRGRT